MRAVWTALAATFCLGGCAGTAQVSTNTEANDFSLDPVAMRSDGIGFLTPVSATGQEANRLALALAFADALADSREHIRVVSLPEVLSAVNRAGLVAEYRAMTDGYAATGIMEGETLRRIGESSDIRYLGLLELADFDQGENRRFSIGGLRLVDTKVASIRVSWQIWDSFTGAIAWEGTEEIHYAYDTGRERPVSFAFVAGKAASNLIARMPRAEISPANAAAAAITP